MHFIFFFFQNKENHIRLELFVKRGGVRFNVWTSIQKCLLWRLIIMKYLWRPGRDIESHVIGLHQHSRSSWCCFKTNGWQLVSSLGSVFYHWLSHPSFTLSTYSKDNVLFINQQLFLLYVRGFSFWGDLFL